ncbi:unnamed protein product [Agarophyton chilense]
MVRDFLRERGEPAHNQRPYFVHRLDYATSGALLMALNRRAAAFAAKQFETRSVSKSYVALVHGHVPRSVQHVDARVAANDGDFRMRLSAMGRAASTKVTVEAHGTWRGRRVSKLRLTPTSGRRHQLRLHCALLGAPIVGDATYGAPHETALFHGRAPPRMMLHAALLSLRLPATAAPLPSRARLRRVHVALRGSRPFALCAGEDPFEPRRLPELRWRHRFDAVHVCGRAPRSLSAPPR